jgi:hypothetical protein
MGFPLLNSPSLATLLNPKCFWGFSYIQYFETVKRDDTLCCGCLLDSESLLSWKVTLLYIHIK